MTEYDLVKRLAAINEQLAQSTQERISGSDGLRYSEEDRLDAERRDIRHKLIAHWDSTVVVGAGRPNPTVNFAEHFSK